MYAHIFSAKPFQLLNIPHACEPGSIYQKAEKVPAGYVLKKLAHQLRVFPDLNLLVHVQVCERGGSGSDGDWIFSWFSPPNFTHYESRSVRF